jgi:hypothetical protein
MWLSRESSLLPTPARHVPDEQPLVRYNDLPLYALRGYRGPEVLVAQKPLERAYKADKFLAAHVADLEYRRSPIPRLLIERDIERIMNMVTTSFAVRIVPLV